MSRWVTSTKPSAELEPETPEPVERDDGALVQILKTRFGKRFAQVTEPSGFVLWLQEVE